MGNCNSEDICQQNDNMAKEDCGLVEENDDLNWRVQSLEFVEYHSEKESSLYTAVYVITGYLASACLV